MLYTVHLNVLLDLHFSAHSVTFFTSAALITSSPLLNAQRGTLELKN